MRLIIISTLYFLFSFVKDVLSDELVIEQSLFNDASFVTTGYSSSSVYSCSGNSVSETNHSFLGAISSGQTVSKSWSGFPPHYLAGVRIDFVLVDNWSQDLFNLLFDGALIAEKLNSSTDNSYNFCGSSYNDLFYRGYWSKSHTANTLQLGVQLQGVSSNSNKYIVFRQIQISIDTCHQSCLTCNGPLYTNCLTCPNGTTDGSDRCYCPAGKYAQTNSCVSACTGGFVPDPTTGFCQLQCTAPQFYFQGNCLTPDPAVKNVQYQLAYGLFSNNFSAITVYNMGWTIKNMGHIGVTTDCGSYRLFGGFVVMSKETLMEIVFYNLPKHYNVKIKLVAVLVDWTSSSNATISLDGTVIETISKPSSGGSQICGNTSSNDYVITLNNAAYAHSNAQMTIDITTNYNSQDVYQFGFGIRQVEIYLDSCPVNCQQCDATGCLNCFSGYLLYSGVCYSPCPAKTYPVTNLAVPKCFDCYSSCATCQLGSASNLCTSCPTGMYLLNGSCVASCGNYYYADTSNVCQSCDSTCLNCLGPASNQCTKCASPLYLNTATSRCVSGPSCPDGTYPEISNRTCMPCDSTCLTCNGSTNTDCLSCTYYLDGTSCVTTCSIGKYPDNIQKKCLPCNSSCYTCVNQPTYCTSCSSPNFLNNSSCSPNCPPSKYGDVPTRTCIVCPNNCTTCLGGQPQNCTGCSQGYFLTLLDTTNNSGTCGLNCTAGYWQDTTYNYCRPCYTNCATCNAPGSQTSCVTCKSTFFLTPTNSCDSACPDRYYPDPATNTCLPCHSTCLRCDAASNQKCTKCDTGRYLLLLTATEGSCYINCPDTYYNDGASSNCLSCFNGCRTCSGNQSNQCAACMPGLYFYKNQCIPTCPAGSYPNAQALQCEDCDLSCSTCNGPLNNNCVSCTGTRFQEGNTCISNCPDGQYNDIATNICKPCDSTCATCDGPSPNQCESCPSGRFLNTNTHTCDQICPSGQYAQSTPQQICKLCNAVCNTCTGPATTDCQGCPDNRFLWNNQCLSNCPVGFFRITSPNSCSQCNETCARCNNSPLPNQCTSCLPGRFLLNQECLLQCPDGYYGDNVLNQCALCNSTCKTCYGIEYNNCLTCYPGTYLIKNTCVVTCPDHYVPDDTTRTCAECPKECATCLISNHKLCTKCQTGWYLLNQQCLQRCPDGYYTDYTTQSCQQCCTNCDECTGPNISDCEKWHWFDIALSKLIIFWIFIGKCAYCGFAFLLGYYLDTKCKPSGRRPTFQDPREVVKYNSIAPAPQIGASGQVTQNRRGRNGTILPSATVFPQSLAYLGPEDEKQYPVKLNAKDVGIEDPDEEEDDYNNPNKKEKVKKGFNPNTPKNPNNEDDSDDDEDDDDGSDENQDPKKNNPNGEDDEDDDDDNEDAPNKTDQTETKKSAQSPEKGNNPNKPPEKKGIKFLRKVIMRHGTLMKLRGDIRKKTDKEILDLIIPKGDEGESNKKKVGADEMVVEAIEVGAGDDNTGQAPQTFQRKKTKNGTVAFDDATSTKSSKLKLKKQKTKSKANLGDNQNGEDDDEGDDFNMFNPKSKKGKGNKQNPNSDPNKTQTTIFNPHGTNTNFNQPTQTRPGTPTTSINSDNKPFMPSVPTLNTQQERSNKVHQKFPNGIGYFRTLLEFYELTTIYIHYDYDIERPLRALMFFSKLLFIFTLTRPYETDIPIYGIAFCMFGLKIVMNCIERIMTKLGRAFDKFLFIFFAAAVIYILFNTFYLFLPTLHWLTYSTDWNWSLKYLMTFGIDLIFFQIGYFTIQYYVTKDITFSNNFTFPMKILGYLFFKENISQFISV